MHFTAPVGDAPTTTMTLFRDAAARRLAAREAFGSFRDLLCETGGSVSSAVMISPSRCANISGIPLRWAVHAACALLVVEVDDGAAAMPPTRAFERDFVGELARQRNIDAERRGIVATASTSTDVDGPELAASASPAAGATAASVDEATFVRVVEALAPKYAPILSEATHLVDAFFAALVATDTPALANDVGIAAAVNAARAHRSERATEAVVTVGQFLIAAGEIGIDVTTARALWATLRRFDDHGSGPAPHAAVVSRVALDRAFSLLRPRPRTELY
jgi:hypothetical protein